MPKPTEAREAVEALRADIEAIQRQVAALREGGVREKTLLILLSHFTGLPQRKVRAVLDGIEGIIPEYFEEVV